MSDEIKPEEEATQQSVGQKRQNSENGGPASKKANIEAGDDTVQIKVLIPSGAVGALIGKGGETMRNLKNDSGCRVQMSKNQEVYHGTNERICLVKGKVSATMTVMAAILEKIQEKIDSNMPSDLYDLKGMDRCKEMKFVVPNTSAGMVIGKSGASIKEIREQTTANIQVYPKAGSEEAKQSIERVITVGHETNSVLLDAVQRVLEKVVADPLHAHPTEGIKSEVGNSAFDFSGGRMGGTSGTQFGNLSGFAGNWNSTTSLVSDSNYSGGNKYNSSLKFNPLQGVGNTELLTFLDNLQSTLRSSGFSESSVSEIMQAMQVLAKYNIMGLGLGLGVAAMAQMRTVENQAVAAQQNALLAAAQASQQQSGGGGMSQQRYDFSIPLNDGHNSSEQTLAGNTGGVLIDVLSQKNKPNNSSSSVNFAASVIKERLNENGLVELEVPDTIIGAVLGPRAKTLVEIQQLSGCKVEVHKRGNANVSEGCRLIREEIRLTSFEFHFVMSVEERRVKEASECIARAKEHLKTSIWKLKTKPDYDNAVVEYDRAAVCFRNAGRLEDCKNAYLELAKCHHENRSQFHEAKAKENAAMICKEMKLYDDAERLFSESIDAYFASGTVSTASQTLDKAAKMFSPVAPEKAAKLYEKGLTFVQQEDAAKTCVDFYNRLICLYVKMERLQNALRVSCDSIEKFCELSEFGKIGNVVLGMAIIHLKLDDSVAALKCLDYMPASIVTMFTGEICALKSLIRAYENYDDDAFQDCLKSPVWRVLDTDFLRLMKTLKAPEGEFVGESGQNRVAEEDEDEDDVR